MKTLTTKPSFEPPQTADLPKESIAGQDMGKALKPQLPKIQNPKISQQKPKKPLKTRQNSDNEKPEFSAENLLKPIENTTQLPLISNQNKQVSDVPDTQKKIVKQPSSTSGADITDDPFFLANLPAILKMKNVVLTG